MSISHIVKRGKERYGLNLDHDDVRRILAVISRGGAERIRWQTRDESWLMEYRGKTIVVVTQRVGRQDSPRREVRTIYPEDFAGKPFTIGQVLKSKERE